MNNNVYSYLKDLSPVSETINHLSTQESRKQQKKCVIYRNQWEECDMKHVSFNSR